jgi:hypothetical protein
MKTLARWAAGLFFIAVLSQASLRARGFFDSIDPDVLTVTDVTDEGRSWPKPEPGKPVYYEAISFGDRNFQGLRGDAEPNSRAMLRLIVSALAEQGFEPTKEKGGAKVFLSICWGYLRANPSPGMLTFLGGEKVDFHPELMRVGLSPLTKPTWMYPRSAQKIVEAASDNLYIASIQAFDLQKLDAGKKVLLWDTRIACSSRRISMAEALPAMIVAAGPFIGKETEKPVWRDVGELKKAHVDFGILKVLEYIEPTEPSTGEDTAQKK